MFSLKSKMGKLSILLCVLLCSGTATLVTTAPIAHAAGAELQVFSAPPNYCLDADLGGVYNNGDKVQIWQCWGGENQHWYTANCNGVGVFAWCEIVNAQSGLCLDADAGGTNNNGDKVQLWQCWGGNNQYWRGGSPLVNNFTTYQNGANNGKCLDAEASGGFPRNGAPVQLWDCHGGANQQWGWF